MNTTRRGTACRTGLVLTLLSAISLSSFSALAGDAMVDAGKAIAFDRKKGNCLACHMISDGQSPGNIAPPIVSMKSRYANKEKLRAQIWDATVANPDTPMPPFGRHQILSDSEIDKVVEFIWTL